jgi:cysteinyl-tRNA synthetase
MYINGLIEKGYSPASIRYTLLTTHYRQRLNFSPAMLDSSTSALKHFDDLLFELDQAKEGPLNAQLPKALENMLKEFEKAMDDDLNISGAMGTVFDGVRSINRIHRETPLSTVDAKAVKDTLKKLDSVLGVIFFREEKEANVDEAFIFQKIEERKQARVDKDWAKADAIRDELDVLGIELVDRKDGTGFKIKD